MLRILAVAIFTFTSTLVWAQVGDVFLSFKQEQIEQPKTGYSFNVLTLTNASANTINGKIDLILPEGLDLLLPIDPKVSLKPDQEKRFILRFTSIQTKVRDLSPIIYANFVDSTDNVLAWTECRVEMERYFEWSVKPLKSQLFYHSTLREIPVQVRLTNSGNVSSTFEFRQGTGQEIELLDLPKRVRLNSFEDTIVELTILLSKEQAQSDKVFTVDWVVESRGEERRFSQSMVAVGNKVLQHPFKWYASSLFLSTTASNLGSRYPILTSQARGNVFLNKRKRLSYYVRNNQRIGSPNGARATLFNVKYKGLGTQIEVGDLNEPTNLFRLGRGLNISQGFGEHRIGALYLEDIRVGERGYAVYHDVALGDNNFLNTVFDAGVSSSSGVTYRVGSTNFTSSWNQDKSELGLKFGYGVQGFSAEELNFEGYTGRINYQGGLAGGALALETEYGSPYYPGIERGTTSILGNYTLEKKGSVWRPQVRYIRNIARFLSNEEVVQAIDLTSALYELNFTPAKQKAGTTLTYGAGYLYDGRDSLLRSGPRGIFIFSRKGKGSNTLRLNLSYTYLNFEFQEIETHQVLGEGSFKTGIFGSNFRGVYGPFFYRDAKYFIDTGEMPFSLSASPYLEQYVFNDRLHLKATVDVFAGNIETYNRLVYRALARVTLPGNFQLNAQGAYTQSPFFTDFRSSISVSKSFIIPMVGFKQYGSIKVVLFKDLDGDKVFSDGDIPISNERIRVNKILLESNVDGELFYQNLKVGTYTLDLSPIRSILGWIAPGGSIQRVIVTDKEDQVVQIPFQKAKIIAGRITVIKDEYSRVNYPLAGVRVRAMGRDSVVYSGFTDETGAFELQVPEGVYMVNFNQSLFLTQFDVLKGELELDLRNKEREDIVFVVKERGRGINIERD